MKRRRRSTARRCWSGARWRRSSTSTGSAAASSTAEPVGDGHSNVTYLIRRDGGEWVLRRPPRPPLPPSAHDVLREAMLLRALEGTAVRVPEGARDLRRRAR